VRIENTKTQKNQPLIRRSRRRPEGGSTRKSGRVENSVNSLLFDGKVIHSFRLGHGIAALSHSVDNA